MKLSRPALAMAVLAATAGPGLIGGLLVGLTAAKAIALVHGLPLIAIPKTMDNDVPGTDYCIGF
ncbi:MAG TPA: 6-phosphofructokinase, partial [Lacipirellulaceae bacterium]|nr:6-phosphofructokinase [Lacipirellulaceae bacterium]